MSKMSASRRDKAVQKKQAAAFNKKRGAMLPMAKAAFFNGQKVLFHALQSPPGVTLADGRIARVVFETSAAAPAELDAELEADEDVPIKDPPACICSQFASPDSSCPRCNPTDLRSFDTQGEDYGT